MLQFLSLRSFEFCGSFDGCLSLFSHFIYLTQVLLLDLFKLLNSLISTHAKKLLWSHSWGNLGRIYDSTLLINAYHLFKQSYVLHYDFSLSFISNNPHKILSSHQVYFLLLLHHLQFLLVQIWSTWSWWSSRSSWCLFLLLCFHLIKKVLRQCCHHPSFLLFIHFTFDLVSMLELECDYVFRLFLLNTTILILLDLCLSLTDSRRDQIYVFLVNTGFLAL